MKKKTITEDEVRDAVRRFVKKGGIIKMLPEETVFSFHLIGWKHGPYEQIFFDGGQEGSIGFQEYEQRRDVTA